MNWFYALAGQQQGPVDDAQLDALLNAGTITPETLVWREGMAGWQPLRQARPVGGTTAVPPPAGLPPVVGAATEGSNEVNCCECGKSFARDQVIQYDNRYVCAGCKPVFMQRLAEGAPLAGAGAGAISEEQLLDREYRVEIGECLERAWKLFTDNVGLIIGTSLVVALLAIACWAVSVIVGLVVPVVNSVISFVVTGPIVGGFSWFFLRLARGEPAAVGDAFAGFGKRFVQLMLCSLVQGLLNLVCVLPVIVIAGIAGFSMSKTGGPPQFSGAMIGAIVLFGLAGGAALMYLNTLWTHSFLLVMDKGYSFWPAMQLSRKLVSKRWWMTWVFLLVGGIISGLGALACGVGLLVTMPLYYAMKVYFYEDNFRDLAKLS